MDDEKRIYQLLYGWFDAPCSFTFANKDVTDIIPWEWCDTHCNKYPLGNWECWRKLFEVWEGDSNA